MIFGVFFSSFWRFFGGDSPFSAVTELEQGLKIVNIESNNFVKHFFHYSAEYSFKFSCNFDANSGK